MVYFPPQNSNSQWANLNEVLRDKDTKSWILLNPTSIGDTWTVCALAKAFKEQHGGALTMVVGESQAALAQMFQSDIDRIIPVNKMILHDLCTRAHHFSTFMIDQPIIAHPFWHGDGRLFELTNLFRYPDRGGIKFSDAIRFVLHLDWESTLAKPTIPEIWREEAERYAKEIGLNFNKSVILFPDNNTIEGLPTQFWQPLADLLNAQGWKVFTNMVGNMRGPRTELFSGTSPISVPLHLAIPLVELAGRFISATNGLAYTLVASKVKSQYCWITIRRKVQEQINGIYQDPFFCQSIRHAGIEYGEINEYDVCPDEDMTSIIQCIAENKPYNA